VNCGNPYDVGDPKSGQLFVKSRPSKSRLSKSKMSVAAAISALLSIGASSILLIMLDSARSTQQESEKLVAQHTRNLAAAKNTAEASLTKYIDWLACSSSAWVCNLLYGFGGDLADTVISDSAQVDIYTSKLQEQEKALAAAVEVTKELTFSLQVVVISGVVSTGSLVAGHLLIAGRNEKQNKNETRKKVGK